MSTWPAEDSFAACPFPLQEKAALTVLEQAEVLSEGGDCLKCRG